PGEDQRFGLVTQAGDDWRHDHARQVVAHDAAEHEGHSLPPLHELWGAVVMEQIAELIGDALGPATAEGLIDEGDGEVFAARILHHAGEAARLRYLSRRLLGAGLAEQRGGQFDGTAGALLAAGHRGHGSHRLACLDRNDQAAAAWRPSEEKVAPVEGQVVVGKRGKRGAVDPDLDGARVDLDPGIRLVVEHVPLAYLARARDGQGAAAASHVQSEFADDRGG